MTPAPRLPLSSFLEAQVTDRPLVELIDAISSGCWSIARALRNIALDGNQGTTDQVNIQGEVQKPLDLLANELFMRALGNCKTLAATLSEEVEAVTWLKHPQKGDFIVCFDPLDGSSNLDVNLSVGTIFSVNVVQADGDTAVLHRGSALVAAGYAIYGPSTMLVLTMGGSVNGFTLDLESDEFILTHPRMQIPQGASEVAINMSRQRHWDQPISAYIADCLASRTDTGGREFNMRWTASMVAEVHRILTRGGVFLYPTDTENRAQGGKLRLMYEAIPMAFIAMAAGGAATDGLTPILDVLPLTPHQRIGVVLGAADEVLRVAAAYS